MCEIESMGAQMNHRRPSGPNWRWSGFGMSRGITIPRRNPGRCVTACAAAAKWETVSSVGVRYWFRSWCLRRQMFEHSSNPGRAKSGHRFRYRTITHEWRGALNPEIGPQIRKLSPIRPDESVANSSIWSLPTTEKGAAWRPSVRSQVLGQAWWISSERCSVVILNPVVGNSLSDAVVGYGQ